MAYERYGFGQDDDRWWSDEPVAPTTPPASTAPTAPTVPSAGIGPSDPRDFAAHPDWKLEDTETIKPGTPEDEMFRFAQDLSKCPSLAAQATPVKSGAHGAGAGTYTPKPGWKVVTYEHKKTGETIILWQSPAGKIWNISTCTGVTLARSETEMVVQNVAVFGLIALVGYYVYKHYEKR